jgi:BASS family bile acid:Na+ symporter
VDLKQAATLVLQLALILMVASVGLRAKWRDVVNTILHFHGLLRAIIAINVVVPAVAVLVCMALPIPPTVKFGIVIMAVSPLAPLVPGKVLKAGMEASRVAGLYALLIALALVIIPATILLLNRLFGLEVTTPIGGIGTLVFISVMAPLIAGMVMAAIAPTLAGRIAGPVNLIGVVGLAIIGIVILVSQASEILKLFGNGAVLAMAVTVTAGIVTGHLLGGPEALGRRCLAMAAATRHPGIAAIIVKANSDDRRILLTLILFLLTSVVVTASYQFWLNRLDRRNAVGAFAI